MSVTRTASALAAHARDRWAPEYDPTAGRLERAAQAGTIITVVVIGVVALVGILIFDSVSTSIPSEALNGTELEGANGTVVDGFANAMELIPIVLLVLVASLVIAVVQRMRRRQ